MACVVPSDSSGLQVGFLTGISSYPVDQRLSHLQRYATQQWRKLVGMGMASLSKIFTV